MNVPANADIGMTGNIGKQENKSGVSSLHPTWHHDFSQLKLICLKGTKGAVDRMTEALAMELEPFGVTVTSVVPGWVKTDLNANSLIDWQR